jgi:hypothetical protein
VTTTSVPPDVLPEVGERLVTVGGVEDWYVKADSRVADMPSGLVTLTATLPGLPAGVRTVIDVAVTC